MQDERHLIGQIDPTEPAVIQQMRKELRVRHKVAGDRAVVCGLGAAVYPALRFGRDGDVWRGGDQDVPDRSGRRGERDRRDAEAGQVRLLFLFQTVLGRELEFLDVARATKPERLPVVLSRPEIAKLLPEFKGLRRLMFELMYGAGLRHRECRRLRVKDVCFDEGHIVVRSGKGDQDRITVLPQRPREALREQIEAVRRLHQRDLDEGFGAVYLPYALERKYPNENREFGWQWVFPAAAAGQGSALGEIPPPSRVGGVSLRTSSSGRWTGWGSPRTPCRIRCATVLRRTCWRTGRISARCRSCSGTRTCGRP